MTKRIFWAIFAVALAVFLAAMVLIIGVLYSYFTQSQQQQLRIQTTLTVQAVSHEGSSYFDSLDIDHCRITWIASDGTVLYDSKSDHATMENHLQREEIQEALKNGYGESTRYSATRMEQSIYTAQQLSDGTVLRLSIHHPTALTLILSMAQPICVIFAIAIVLSFFLASRLSKHIVKPLNELDLDNPLSNTDYSELSPLLHRIDSQQKQLRLQARELKRKQDEFESITGYMNEGLLLLNNTGIVITMNTAAAKMLGFQHSSIGRNIVEVSKNRALNKLVSIGLTGQKTEKILSLPGGSCQLDVSPVYSGGLVTGVALLVFDVSDRLKAESLRREFTANVSHELKTPLHAISGYAELLSAGIARPEDVLRFSGKIYAEAQRMIQLVEDILRLSRLDEGAGDMRWEQTDLHQLIQQAAASLAPAAAQAQVTLSIQGTPTILRGIPHLLTAIILNLGSNAIKYNHPGGSVVIKTDSHDAEITLTVQDTGIGIPAEHQDRIFERFYRVDKSHSKEVGGTGLGLSIVKHAALIHGAEIHLESIVNQGTTVTVSFPKTRN